MQDFDAILNEVRKRVVRKYGDLLVNDQTHKDVDEAIRKEARTVLGGADHDLEDAIVAHLVGLGPVDRLLRDPDVSEIMINAPDEIYVERNGRVEKSDLAYRDADEVLSVLYRIVQRCGRKVNFSSPLVDARLPDGSRVNAIIPPSSQHPVITIRRFVRKVFSTKELVETGFISEEMVPFFETVVRGKANIVICGATGCGKTTFLRWLCGFIYPSERLLTIEDTRELNLDHEHCISLEATPKAGIHDLMINALRMRPDRIILGEVRGAEAFELLQAMGTGHEGSLTSIHANYGKMEAIHRLIRAMIKAGGVTVEELEAMISESIDLLVFVKRYPDGSRRVVHVTQVESERGRPVFRDIFRYRKGKNLHERVGSISDDLTARLRDNLLTEAPKLAVLGSGAHA